MKRTLVGFPDNDIAELDALSEIQHVSRAELIRQAVSQFLDKCKPTDASEEAFGLWADKNVDGLTYQQRMREEW